jgi:hypothetical protein
MTALVTWIVWSDSAPLRSPTELGRVRAPDKSVAESLARERFPGVRILVQSAASASVAEKVPLERPVKLYGAQRARAKQARQHERAQKSLGRRQS